MRDRPLSRRSFLHDALCVAGGAAATSILAWPMFAPRGARAAEPAPSPVVETIAGKIRGITADGIHAFKGVHYGARTGGVHRFMPPKPPRPWSGIKDTVAYGFSAPQRDPAIPRDRPLTGAALLIGDLSALPEHEDCLVLNVWTPAVNSGGKRPVMVWCHGGGFSSGSGSSPGYDGTNLCKRGDVVVVTINHRLNAMGFTHLADVAGDEFAQSGNVGMLDIVQALQWVRDNIAQFGGDPSTVTIFGESGGGRKVSTLLAMPAAQGLYQRAIIQSGPGLRMMDRETANAATLALLAELGIDKSKARDLQQVPIASLIGAYHKVARAREAAVRSPTASFAPVVDGSVLPSHPFDPAAPAISADVPLMIGSNKTEATLFNAGDEKAFALDEAGLRQRVEPMLGPASAAVLAAYRKAHPRASPSDRFFFIETDLRYGVPSKVLAARKAEAKRAPCWVYRFDWETPVMGGRFKSPHALEIPFAFDHAIESKALTGGGAEAVALADKVSDAWIAFARSGDPNVPKLPKWPAYTTTQRATMLFNDESQVANDPDKRTRVAMEKALGFGSGVG